MSENEVATFDQQLASLRGTLLLASNDDPRVPAIYPADWTGICGEVDGPTFMVVGPQVSDARLRDFAGLVGLDAQVLIQYRNSLAH